MKKIPGTTLVTSVAPSTVGRSYEATPGRGYAVPASAATMSRAKGSITSGQIAKLLDLGVTSETYGSPLRNLSTHEAFELIRETIAEKKRLC